MSNRLGVVMVLLVVACGGGAPRDEPTAVQPAPAEPRRDRVAEHWKQLGERLAACKEDVPQRWPGEACRQAIRTLVAGCGSADLRELERTDRVSERCKASLRELLPADDSVRSRLLVLGAARVRGGLDVYVAASDARGEPGPIDAPRVYLELATGLELVGGVRVEAAWPQRCERPAIALSSILDYSGSMSDRDVDESIEIFRALYDAIPDGCLESDVVVFSTDVRRRAGFRSDREALRAAVTRDSSMPRATTALYDALGEGVTGVGDRAAPVRIAVVATDGKENASTRTSWERLVGAARGRGVRVVSFGSLLSDVDVLDQLGAETGGAFVYRPHPRLLATAAEAVGRVLASARRVHVADARLAAASHVIIELDGQRVRVAL